MLSIAAVLSEENFFSMHMTLFGRAPLRPLLRTGARVGDSIYVGGKLGLSFESGKHLTFEPRIAQGRFLASVEGVGACTDLSDGFASDIKNILPKGACAEIYKQSIPYSQLDGRKATLREALCGGEDYELLFTFRGDKERFEGQWKSLFGTVPYEIGKIVEVNEFAEFSIITVDDCGVCGLFNESGFDHIKKP